MRGAIPLLALLAALSLAAPARAEESTGPGPTAATQLQGLDQAAAQDLIGKLEGAQSDLRQGNGTFFALLSGAPASYKEAGLYPRDAFLGLSFARPFSVTRLAPDGASRKTYRLVLLPYGPGRIVCEVDVVLGVNGRIERIQLFYGPPAPF